VADRGLAAAAGRVLDWALDFDSPDPRTVFGLARLIASGTLVLGVGIGIAVHSYVRSGFRWPSEVRRG
jgi:hypothetical protein